MYIFSIILISNNDPKFLISIQYLIVKLYR